MLLRMILKVAFKYNSFMVFWFDVLIFALSTLGNGFSSSNGHRLMNCQNGG